MTDYPKREDYQLVLRPIKADSPCEGCCFCDGRSCRFEPNDGPEWVEECSTSDGIYKVWKKKQQPNTEDKK